MTPGLKQRVLLLENIFLLHLCCCFPPCRLNTDDVAELLLCFSPCRSVCFCWRFKLVEFVLNSVKHCVVTTDAVCWFDSWYLRQTLQLENGTKFFIMRPFPIKFTHYWLIIYCSKLFRSRFSSFVDVMERKLTATRGRQQFNIVETNSCSLNVCCFISLYSNKLCLMWRYIQDQFLLHLYTLCYDCSRWFTMRSFALLLRIFFFFLRFSWRCFMQILQISCYMFGCSKQI